MPTQSIRYNVESYCWEVFSGNRDEIVLSGWLVSDTKPTAMTLEFDGERSRRFPIDSFNLRSPGLEGLGPEAAHARFHAVIRIGDDPLDFERSRLLVEFSPRRRVGIDLRSVFDHGVATSPETLALLSSCESLGDSCEFGFVQRTLGVDQLGLFRFTGSGDPLRIAEAIENDFEGFAEGDDLEAGELLSEWVVKSRRYDFVLHTGRFPYSMSESEIRRQESVKLRYLARKFLEDLADAEKLFVRRCEGGDERGMLELHAAMRARGPTRMVWITLADADHPPGTVREVAPGLYRGYCSYLAPLDQATRNRPDLWVDLLSRVPAAA